MAALPVPTNNLPVILATVLQVFDDDDELLLLQETMREEQNDMPIWRLAGLLTGTRASKLRTKGFLKDTIPSYSPSDFYSHFHIHRATVEKITLEFRRYRTDEIKSGPRPLSVETIVLLGLWTLANTESFDQISERFDVARSTAHEVFDDFCKVLVSCIPTFVTWPTPAEMVDIAVAFEIGTGFPGAVGAIGGSHIPIKKPKENPEAYFNRKQYYSINVMAIVDHRMSFRHIYVGWPGSVQNARVYRNSPIYQLLTDNSMPQEFHVLGDSAFPQSNSLLVPYQDDGHLTPRQMSFNTVHLKTRVIVANAFGLLKGKFSRIKTLLDVTDTKRASTITSAACVVHNIYIAENDWLLDEIVHEEPNDSADPAIYQDSKDGQKKRNAIAKELPSII